MSSLYDVLDDYGLAGNEKATKLVESLLESLSDLAGSEEPAQKKEKKPPRTACVGTYTTKHGETAVVSYDRRWVGDSAEPYPLLGVTTGSFGSESWTDLGRYLDSGEHDEDDLAIPPGLVHVHYVRVVSDDGYGCPSHPIFPFSVISYEQLADARENAAGLPILRITYRDEKIISAQLVNDWEVA